MVAIGYVLSSEDFEAPYLLEMGAAAEQAGFDMLWMSDHFHPWQDNQGHAPQAWVTLAALAQKVGKIPFGTGVTCPTYRYNPAIVAQVWATLANLFPKRVFLGVGTGEALNEQPASGQWGEYEERADRLIEAIIVMRRLWEGEWVKHSGRHYQVENARLYSPPANPIPIYMAASGEQSLYIAGQYGDGLITDGETVMDKTKMEPFRQGVKSSARNVDALPIITENFVFVGTEDEARKAAERWRFLPKAWDVHVDDPDPRSIQREAERRTSLDEVIAMWTVGDDPQPHIDKIQKLADAGATHIFIHAGNEDQERAIAFYRREVLPHVKHEKMKM